MTDMCETCKDLSFDDVMADHVHVDQTIECNCETLIIRRLKNINKYKNLAKGNSKKQERLGLRFNEASLILGLVRGKEISGEEVEHDQ